MMKPTVVILAGGIGKRFVPFITSKPLFPFFGIPLLKHLLDQLTRTGWGQVIVVASADNFSDIKRLISSQRQMTVVVQNRPSGMADALLTVENRIANKPILVVNATDVVADSLLINLKTQILKRKPLIAACRVSSYFPGGYLVFAGKRLVGIREKPGEGKEPSDLVKLVFDYFSSAQEILTLIKATTSDKDDAYEKALSVLIQTRPVEVVSYEDYWQPFKYSWHILDMVEVFLKERLIPGREGAEVEKMAVVDKGVFLGKGVRVMAGAVIKAPSYIGVNTVVGNNVLIRESIIEGDCVIGFGSEVARSYIGENCWLHTNYIGDSVLESDVAFGSGAVTGNFRLDGKEVGVDVLGGKLLTSKIKLGALVAKGVKVGVNASLMPGVSLGTMAMIGPGTLVKEPILANTRVFVKQTLLSKGRLSEKDDKKR